MTVRRAAGLLIAALMWASAASAEVRRAPPAFTPEELALIHRDAKLVYAAKVCPWQLRRALDAWNELRRGARPAPAEPEPCTEPEDDMGRASDEAALDILKILKEAAGQGTSQ